MNNCNPRWPRAFSVGFWLLSPAILGGCERECSRDDSRELFLIRRDVGCPSAEEAETVLRENQSIEHSSRATKATVFLPDRTMCWYRWVDLDDDVECATEPRDGIGYVVDRDYYLDLAWRDSPRVLTGTSPIGTLTESRTVGSCDAEGRLWGVTLTDASGAILETEDRADCPLEPQTYPTIGVVDGLVGGDRYPALVTCTYTVITQVQCGGVGAAPLGL